TPALALIGRQLPWHVALFPTESAVSALPVEPIVPAAPAPPPVRAFDPPPAKGGDLPRPPKTSKPHAAVPSASHAAPLLPRAEGRISDPAPPPFPAQEEAAEPGRRS